MLIKVKSATNVGLEMIGVDVEVHVANRGLPGFDIVGLPDKAVSESRERVKAAIQNSKIEFPNKKIIVNLAPADIPKEGSFYDLPIAAGLLASQFAVKIPEKSLFFGELSMDGSLRHTKGAFLLAIFAKEQGFENVFVPKDSAAEASVIEGINVYPVESLNHLLRHISGRKLIERACASSEEAQSARRAEEAEFDMAEILGQEQAKRAMEIAAAGAHNILLIGSPGAGKTMLARALPGILPLLAHEESLEVTKIYSAAGQIPANCSLITNRPVRSPHHSTSMVGLIGGGTKPQPGEISLAHRGVLFLDEFNEFSQHVLESLRQPLEDGNITVARARGRVQFPARFMLVASANPCPCGYLHHPKKQCVCSQQQIRNYQKRISGPILDRIDLSVEVPAVDIREMAKKDVMLGENSENIRQRVAAARSIQEERFSGDTIFSNAEMKNNHIKKYSRLSREAEQILQQAALKFQLSARSYLKMIKVSRTIADLAGVTDIRANHMAEALQYKTKVYES